MHRTYDRPSSSTLGGSDGKPRAKSQSRKEKAERREAKTCGASSPFRKCAREGSPKEQRWQEGALALAPNRWRFVHTVASVFCLVAVWLSHLGASAHEARVDIGLLTCNIVQITETGATGEALAPDGRELLCTFTPTASRPEETYSGSVQSIGSDNELSAGRAMIWIVLAPSEVDMTPGLLQQVYAADSAAALRQAPPLLGQTNGSIVLQDLTDAKQLGAAAGRQDDLASTIVLLVLRLRTTPT
jgi:uncharacterized protein DUF992